MHAIAEGNFARLAMKHICEQLTLKQPRQFTSKYLPVIVHDYYDHSYVSSHCSPAYTRVIL